jgi:hypothetical protein
MNENDEHVVHAGIVSKAQKIPEFRPFLEFANDTLESNALLETRCRPAGPSQ